jgi:hypothetical protein
VVAGASLADPKDCSRHGYLCRRSKSMIVRLGRRSLTTFDHFADCRREFIYARAGHNDGVAAAVRFLSDPQEFSPVILPEFHVKMFAFDL